MTLASEDGNRLLSKKPYRDVLQRWRMCLATLFLVVVVLADNFRVSSSCTSTTTAAAATTSAAFVMAVVITGPMFPSGSSSKMTATAQTASARMAHDDGIRPPSSTPSPSTSSQPPPPTPSHVPLPPGQLMSTHNPWISSHFLSNYTFNAIARSSKCLQSVSTPENICDYTSNSTCLHLMLGRDKVEEVCQLRSSLLDKFADFRMRFCYRFPLKRVLGDSGLQNLLNVSVTQCTRLLNELQDIDEVAQRVYCEFEQILSRYDCLQHYSIRWNCNDCTESYKAWVCSMMIPFHEGDRFIKPCRDMCHSMEQKCPYFLPDARLQYAGEPTFLCIDHDIPETETMIDNSSYGEPPNCYLPCHSDSRNRTMDHCIYPFVVNSSGTSASGGSNSSLSSYFTNTTSTSSASSGSLWRNSSVKVFTLYVAFFGLLARTFFSSPPFCLGLT